MADVASNSAEQIIGVSRCSNCQKRFRIPEKHRSLVGKPIRCPACREQFVVTLDVPSNVEQAAIQNSEKAQEQEKRTRTRRTRVQIRQEHLDRIRENINPRLKQLAALFEQGCSEEQIRLWCVDVLKSAMGYQPEEIDTEVNALGQRIDIALRHEGKIFLIIECKAPRARLNDAVRAQAVMYAVNKGAEWTVATNGADWKLWRVIPRRGEDPLAIPVFNIGLLDEDGLSEDDVNGFYLLTRRAVFNGETIQEFHRQEAANDERLVQALVSEKVIAAVTKALNEKYAAECGENAKLAEEFVQGRMEVFLLPEEL